MEGIAIRTRVLWLLEGEKPTRYFCNLENRNFISKIISFLEKDEKRRTTVSNQKEILKELYIFFETLYSLKEIEDIELDL